jgi:hypothetical protein
LFIQELEQNYDGFAASLQGLSILEQEMDKPLKKFAEATDTYAKSLKEMVYIKYNRQIPFYLDSIFHLETTTKCIVFKRRARID